VATTAKKRGAAKPPARVVNEVVGLVTAAVDRLAAALRFENEGKSAGFAIASVAASVGKLAERYSPEVNAKATDALTKIGTALTRIADLEERKFNVAMADRERERAAAAAANKT